MSAREANFLKRGLVTFLSLQQRAWARVARELATPAGDPCCHSVAAGAAPAPAAKRSSAFSAARRARPKRRQRPAASRRSRAAHGRAAGATSSCTPSCASPSMRWCCARSRCGQVASVSELVRYCPSSHASANVTRFRMPRVVMLLQYWLAPRFTCRNSGRRQLLRVLQGSVLLQRRRRPAFRSRSGARTWSSSRRQCCAQSSLAPPSSGRRPSSRPWLRCGACRRGSRDKACSSSGSKRSSLRPGTGRSTVS